MAMNLFHLNSSLLTSSTQPLFFFFLQHQHQHKPMMSMSLHHRHSPLSLSPISSSFNKTPNPSNHPSRKRPSTPARDHTITFGKHRGQMLGTIPSDYLNWVSRNLRGEDTRYWAELADEVLADPVYKDRREWDSAHSILSGDNPNTHRLSSDSGCSEFFQMTRKFGWDFEDSIGWSRVNVALLGTSKGGRIPRKNSNANANANANGEKLKRDKVLVRGKRGERIERRRMRLKEEQEEGMGAFERRKKMLSSEEDDHGNLVQNPNPSPSPERESRFKKKMLSSEDDHGNLGRNQNPNPSPEREFLFEKKMLSSEKEDGNLGRNRNPFPGRESLFEKMRQRRRDRSG